MYSGAIVQLVEQQILGLHGGGSNPSGPVVNFNGGLSG